MGTPWHLQKPGRPTYVVMQEFRVNLLSDLLETGRFDITETDHKSPRYAAMRLSNKEIKIHAQVLAGTEIKDYDVARRVFIAAALGVTSQ